MLKAKKHLIAGIFLALALLMTVPSFALAPEVGYAQTSSSSGSLIPPITVPGATGKGIDPQTTARNIIGYVGGFLGLLATCIVLYAGFKWMTSMGSKDKVAEAQKIMIQGLIGLAIIIAASGIAQFAATQIMQQVK